MSQLGPVGCLTVSILPCFTRTKQRKKISDLNLSDVGSVNVRAIMSEYSASYFHQKNDTLIKHKNGDIVIEEKKEHMLWRTV